MSGLAPIAVLEGIDGSGKGTQVEALDRRLSASGVRVGRMTFPQYDANRFGGMIGRFLNGEFGSLEQVAPELAALLFAGDRLESRPAIEQKRSACDVLLLDRYVASNVAHQAGRLDGERRDQLVLFLDWLEHDLHGLPRPDVTVWLDLPADVARQRVAAKAARTYTDREADIQEDDAEHLNRARAVYETLAGGERWARVDTVPDGRAMSVDEVSDAVEAAVRGRLTL